MTQQTASNVRITPRQLEILRLIARFQARRCYSATIAELAEAARVSRTTAFEHTESLRRKGLLTESKGRARSLKLTESGNRLLEQHSLLQEEEQSTGGLKLLGRVAAGAPIEAIQNTEDISLRKIFGDDEDVFALEVTGDSMIGEGIDSGDYVICKKARGAVQGQMVVAIVEKENATLKRFYRDNDRVRLEASNPAYEPIYTRHCRIEAHVLGVIKRL